MRRTPWWNGGVNFACQPDCGACCDQPGGVVFLLARTFSVSPHEQAWRNLTGSVGTAPRP